MTSDDMNKLSIEQLLSHACNSVPNEDPIKYFNSMYGSISPTMIQEAVRVGRREVGKENKKNGKLASVYMTLGGDGINKSLFTGAIGTMLWLDEYLKQTANHFGISDADLETTLRVLRTVNLPQAFDAKFDENEGKMHEPSSCRHYAACLSSFVAWLTNGCTKVQCKGKQRSNMELVRYLTNISLNSFPAIPFTAYPIGNVKTNDPMELAERMSKVVDFSKYMTDESIAINQPKFVVLNESAPIVGIPGHPLGAMVIGQESNGVVEWMGLFTESEEFVKLCAKNGLTSKDVKKYMYMTSDAEHAKNLERGNPVAKFVDSQHFTKEMFKQKGKLFGVEDEEYVI